MSLTLGPKVAQGPRVNTSPASRRPKPPTHPGQPLPTQPTQPRSSRFRANHFIRSVLMMGAGSAMAQALAISFSPLLTRLYTPADFGKLALFSSILALYFPFCSLKLEMAIPLESDEKKANSLTDLCLFLLWVNTGLASLFVFLFAEIIAQSLGFPALAPYLWCLPLAVLGGGATQILTSRATRDRHYNFVSRAITIRAGGQGLLQTLLAVLFTAGAPFLILGLTFSHLAAAFSLRRSLKRPPFVYAPKSWRTIAGQHRNFIYYSILGSFLGVASIHAIPPLLAALIDLESMGHFSLAMRMLGMPAMLIGSAIAQVFYPEAARIKEDRHASALMLGSLAIRLLSLALCIYGLLAIHAVEIFVFVFGEPWKIAGELAVILSLGFLANFVSSPLSSYVYLHQRQRQQLLFSFLILMARTGAVTLGAWWGGLYGAMIGYSFVSTINAFLWVSWVLRLAGVSPWTWLCEHLKLLLTLVSLLSMIALFAHLTDGQLWPLSLFLGAIVCAFPLLPLFKPSPATPY